MRRTRQPMIVADLVRTRRGDYHRRIEQHLERTERLPAPLRTETQEHDVASVEVDVERGGLAVQGLLADQIARQQRRARVLVPREQGALEAVERLEHRAAVGEDRGLLFCAAGCWATTIARARRS